MRTGVVQFCAVLLLAAWPASADADCTCRARGVVAEMGETLCIPAPNGVRLARCDKVLNVASWTFLDGPCPQAGLSAQRLLASATHAPLSIPVSR